MQRFDRLSINDLAGWLIAILLIIVAFPAQAQSFPALTGRVVDAANIIPPDQEAALDAKLAALETTTDRQLVVATIPSLEGYPIDDYGYRLGRAWGIGQKETDNGAVLIVAPNDRKMRVEVGYGLEPILTDAWSSVLINTVIVPQFKAGNYPGGIAAGVDALITQLQLPPEEAAKRAAQAGKQSARQSSNVSMGDIVFWLVIFFFFILPMLRSMFGRSAGDGMAVARSLSGAAAMIMIGAVAAALAVEAVSAAAVDFRAVAAALAAAAHRGDGDGTDTLTFT